MIFVASPGTSFFRFRLNVRNHHLSRRFVLIHDLFIFFLLQNDLIDLLVQCSNDPRGSSRPVCLGINTKRVKIWD